jgi:hypothetical protein
MNRFWHLLIAERVSLIVEFSPAVLLALAWAALKSSARRDTAGVIDRSGKRRTP